MTGAAAATTFPTVKRLDPALPAYAGYTGDHWMLAAGAVVDRVFAVNDAVQFVAALIACITLVVGPSLLGQRWRNRHFMTRASVLGAALCVLSYHLLVLTPRMQVNLRAYWRSAQAGESAQAESFRMAFSADHPTAQMVLVTLALLTLIALFLGAASSADGEIAPIAHTSTRSQLEPPALLKGVR